MKNWFKKILSLKNTDKELKELRKSLKVRRKWFHRHDNKLPSSFIIISDRPDEPHITTSTPIDNEYVMNMCSTMSKYYTNKQGGL